MTIREIPIPYRIDRNPNTTHPEEVLQNPEVGTNCELLVQAIVMARGFRLPRLRSSDLYEDTEFTTHVNGISQAQTGDIIGLRPSRKKDFRGVHIGIIWIDNYGEIHILHNARHAEQARLEALSEAMKYPQHETVAWIKRPIVEDPSLLKPDKLRELGFGYLVREA